MDLDISFHSIICKKILWEKNQISVLFLRKPSTSTTAQTTVDLDNGSCISHAVTEDDIQSHSIHFRVIKKKSNQSVEGTVLPTTTD